MSLDLQKISSKERGREERKRDRERKKHDRKKENRSLTYVKSRVFNFIDKKNIQLNE